MINHSLVSKNLTESIKMYSNTLILFEFHLQKVFLNPTELESLHNCVYGTRMCLPTGYSKTTNPKTNEAYGKE